MRIVSASEPSYSSARSASTFCISGCWSSTLAEGRALARSGAAPATAAMRMARGRADHAVEARHRHHLDDGAHAAALRRRPSRPARRAARSRWRRWRRCPSCCFRRRICIGVLACRRAASAAAGSTTARPAPAPAPGRRRTSAPRRSTCGRPVRRPGPARSRPAGTARVVLARTSEPPCFSVIAMPMVMPCFCVGRARCAGRRRAR